MGEGRGQKAEGRGQKAEGRRQKAEAKGRQRLYGVWSLKRLLPSASPFLKRPQPLTSLLTLLPSFAYLQELYPRLRVVVFTVTLSVMFYTNRRGLHASAGLIALLAIVPAALFAIAPVQAQSIQNLDIVTIGPRFSPNPLDVRGIAGGDMPLKDVVNLAKTPTGECAGYTSAKPNQTIELTEFFESLSLVVQSSEDTALAIQGPGGVWCNDDYQGKNPGVSGQWLPGTYKIWISSYAKNRAPAYTLRITEKRQ